MLIHASFSFQHQKQTPEHKLSRVCVYVLPVRSEETKSALESSGFYLLIFSTTARLLFQKQMYF